MNDRYLYRAKRCDTGEWIVGSSIQATYLGSIRSWISSEQEDKARLREISSNQAVLRTFEVRTDTICQCTGREGEWEHDVFQYDDERYEIQFCEDSLTWEAVSVFSSESIELGEFIPSEYVRLGNSIDNPELLEVGYW